MEQLFNLKLRETITNVGKITIFDENRLYQFQRWEGIITLLFPTLTLPVSETSRRPWSRAKKQAMILERRPKMELLSPFHSLVNFM